MHQSGLDSGGIDALINCSIEMKSIHAFNFMAPVLLYVIACCWSCYAAPHYVGTGTISHNAKNYFA